MPLTNLPALAALALLATTLVGCASGPIEERADGGAPVCTRTYPLGSNIPTTTCVSAETAAEQKRQFDQNSLRLPIPIPKTAGGG